MKLGLGGLCSDPRLLVGASLSNSVEGILAYSALCPHAGCNLTTWVPEAGVLPATGIRPNSTRVRPGEFPEVPDGGAIRVFKLSGDR